MKDQDLYYFLAGDASYTQENMLKEKVDGVSVKNEVALNTLKNIKLFSKANSTIYLPSRDPKSESRLKNQELAYVSEQNKAV